MRRASRVVSMDGGRAVDRDGRCRVAMERRARVLRTRELSSGHICPAQRPKVTVSKLQRCIARARGVGKKREKEGGSSSSCRLETAVCRCR